MFRTAITAWLFLAMAAGSAFAQPDSSNFSEIGSPKSFIQVFGWDEGCLNPKNEKGSFDSGKQLIAKCGPISEVPVFSPIGDEIGTADLTDVRFPNLLPENRSLGLVQVRSNNRDYWVRALRFSTHADNRWELGGAAIGGIMSNLIGSRLRISPRINVAPKFLPWPPLIPSARANITSKINMGKTYGEINRSLSQLLRRHDYSDPSYFTVDDGFALVAPLEHIDDRGDPMPASDRWYFEKPVATTWSEYWSQLFSGPSGRYRLLCFIVTDAPFSAQTSQPNSDDLKRWTTTGDLALSAKAVVQPVTPDTQIQLFVYEFEKGRGRSAERLIPSESPLPVAMHLKVLGLHE